MDLRENENDKVELRIVEIIIEVRVNDYNVSIFFVILCSFEKGENEITGYGLKSSHFY